MTATADTLARDKARTVQADLNYLTPVAEKPRIFNYQPPPGEPERNFTSTAHRVTISDLRGREGEPRLDREGFAALSHGSAERRFDDDDDIVARYYPESAEVLRAATGASLVFIFDHTVRRRIPGQEDRRGGPRQPVARVHVDQTAWSGPERVRRHMGEDAGALLRGRVQIVNLWRPIRGPVLDRPLAVCEAGSVAGADLVATDLVYPDRVGETYSVTYSPDHRWHYLSGMGTDEVLLLKCYDSETDGRARFSPHTAFVDPSAPEDVPPRESIELRALVFHA